MGAIPAWMLRHTITIEAYRGTNGMGRVVYDVAVTVKAFVDYKRRLVRDGNGDQVVSEATAYAPLATDCPPQSRVTLPDGRIAIALAANRRDGGGLPTPDHLEISTT